MPCSNDPRETDTAQLLDTHPCGCGVIQCELFQKTGSFKARGASNAVANLPEGVKDVVTHSSGERVQ